MKKIFRIFILFLLISIIYLVLFPYFDNQTSRGNRKYSILSSSEIQDSLPGKYYYEFEEIFSLDQLLAKTADSIFIRSFINSYKTLKDPENYKVHFTNNYTSSTLNCFSYYLKTMDEGYLELLKKKCILDV